MNWLTFIHNAEVAGERISSVLPEAPRAWRELEHPVNGLRLVASSPLSKGDAIARALFVEAAFRED